MPPTLTMILGVCMRWLHIISMALLIGAVYYALRTSRAMAPAYCSTVYAGVVGVLVSGLYNFFTKPSYPPHYHVWFGVKVLLALHIFAALIVLAQRAKRSAEQARTMRSIMLSAAAVIAISAYLRWISLSPAVKLP
ncbi:MAG TPA: hypothetical protein VFA28_20915 [Bryobacteraceae bacterium]|nr:hypothetical protein [Bryobacteraceae bacterium]